MQLGNDENSTSSLFSVASSSKERRQTALGKMLSKSDEGTDEVLNYSGIVSGIIRRESMQSGWEFSLDNLTYSGSNQNLPFDFAPQLTGFLKNDNDSMFFKGSSFDANAVLVNGKGEYLAAIKFRNKPAIIWISKKIDNSLQDAIAVLFGVIIGMKGN